MPLTGTYSVEYEFGETGDNPALTFVLDIEYSYRPPAPRRWMEPPDDGDLDIEADLFLLDGTKRVAVPAPVKAWLMERIDLGQYAGKIAEQAAQDAAAAADDAADRARDSRMEEADHER